VQKGTYPGKSTIVVLPMIDLDPGNPTCVYSTLWYMSDLARKYNITPILTYHPPLWYMAWGIGLSTISISAPEAEVLIWLMFIGYIGGRICEGIFQFFVGSFDIFIWQKFDSFSRLITARRNPNLILLTGGWIINRPDLGFLSVVIWHLISTVILAIRVVSGWCVRKRHGPLKSWFEEITPGQENGELAVRIFTRTPVNINDRRIAN